MFYLIRIEHNSSLFFCQVLKWGCWNFGCFLHSPVLLIRLDFWWKTLKSLFDFHMSSIFPLKVLLNYRLGLFCWNLYRNFFFEIRFLFETQLVHVQSIFLAPHWQKMRLRLLLYFMKFVQKSIASLLFLFGPLINLYHSEVRQRLTKEKLEYSWTDWVYSHSIKLHPCRRRKSQCHCSSCSRCFKFLV